MDESSQAQAHLTRRERRQLMRNQDPSVAHSGHALRRLMIWGGTTLVLVLVGWAMVSLSNRAIVPSGNGTLTVPVSNTDNSTGPIGAPVTLVEYSDFQCPACAAFYPVVKQAMAEPQLKDKIRFVYRYFPLTTIHANAELAARAAQAASTLGKFWEMHDVLFKEQNAWARLSGDAAKTKFIGYAKDLGMDAGAFEAALNSAAVKDTVKEQSDGGLRVGINSTPTFFINGKEMAQPSSYDEFKQFLLNAFNPNP